MIHIVDRERLAAYRELLAQPVDPTISERFGHHITAPATPQLDIEQLKSQFVLHLMYLRLERDGDV